MNVVVVMFDSLRHDHLACNGHPYVRTPNIDALAAESAVFTNAFAEYPITIPSRTALVTGSYTFTNRSWSPLRDGEQTLAGRLQAAGYHTCAFSDSPFAAGPRMDRGFDEFYWIPGGKCQSPVNPDTQVDMSGVHFTPETSPNDVRYLQYSMMNREEITRREGMYFPDIITREAVDWLTSRQADAQHKDDNFFLWLDYFDPHEPWNPPPPYSELYDPDYKGKFIPMPGMHSKYLSETEMRHLLAQYDGCVTQVDEQLGKLVAALKQLKLWDNTLLVLVSDHGEPFGEHGQIRKFDVPVYDELARIVWMIRDPNRTANAERIEALAQNVDFSPTIMGCLGLEIPAVNGRDLSPVLRGETRDVREYSFSGAFQVRQSVRTREWKFIDNRGERENELFNMNDDPCEHNNLALSEPDRVSEMHRLLWDFGMEWSGVLAWRDGTRPAR